MEPISTLPARARFIGKDGFMGLKRGEIYMVEVFIVEAMLGHAPRICVARTGDLSLKAPYKSMKKLLRDWDFLLR